MANNGTIIVAGLTGLAVGAALGMLVAPHSGEENRAILKEKAEQVRRSARDMANKMARRGQQSISDSDTA
jgi:gas vesicle protein